MPKLCFLAHMFGQIARPSLNLRISSRGALRSSVRSVRHGSVRIFRTARWSGVNLTDQNLIILIGPKFAKKIDFLVFNKTGDFVSRFSQWKMRRPKKRSTPRRSARKKEKDSSLRIFILDTLSQRFLRNIFIDLQFFEKNKNLCFFQKPFAPLLASPRALKTQLWIRKLHILSWVEIL